jgi:uncharacterized protein
VTKHSLDTTVEKATQRLTYSRALELLHQYGAGRQWASHCTAVSEVAHFCGKVFIQKREIDIEFMRTAGLLHDIGRYETHDPVLHGIAGYNLMKDLGYPREAFVCASHILYGLARSDAIKYGLPPQDFIPISLEEKLIPLIDYLIEFDQPTTLAKRFSSLRDRCAANTFFIENLANAEKTAMDVMQYINSEFGVSIEDLVAAAL